MTTERPLQKAKRKRTRSKRGSEARQRPQRGPNQLRGVDEGGKELDRESARAMTIKHHGVIRSTKNQKVMSFGKTSRFSNFCGRDAKLDRLGIAAPGSWKQRC